MFGFNIWINVEDVFLLSTHRAEPLPQEIHWCHSLRLIRFGLLLCDAGMCAGCSLPAVAWVCGGWHLLFGPRFVSVLWPYRSLRCLTPDLKRCHFAARDSQAAVTWQTCKCANVIASEAPAVSTPVEPSPRAGPSDLQDLNLWADWVIMWRIKIK